MKRFSLISLLLCFIQVFADQNANDPASKNIGFENINSQKEILRYDLNQIITLIEKSITAKQPIVAPKDATPFEKQLFTARRIQHNDSQLQAIRQFKYLLEFENYRTEGEKLYIKYLLATSLKYIGSPLIASKYLNNVFPDLLNYIDDYHYKSFFLNQYAGLLVSLDSLEKAKRIYKQIINYSLGEKDTSLMYRSRNNYGYVLMKLHEYDSASKYIRLNQNPIYKSTNEILFAFSYGNYGSLLYALGKLDSALYYCQLEVNYLNAFSTQIGLSNTYETIGDTYIKLNQNDSAETCYLKALELAKNGEELDQIIDLHEKLLVLYIKNRNHNNLLRLTNNYFNYNDSLKNKISYKTYVDEIQISKFMEIMTEAQLSKRNFDELEASNRELFQIIIALTLLSLILIALVLVRRSGRSKLSAANFELIKKNKELKKSHQAISESNSKNETLLKELHHRVKNNLQMISSLFNLQLNAQKFNSTTANVFRAAQDRIYSISLVHKKIYQSNQIEQMEFVDYLKDFTNEIINSHRLDVSVKIELNPIYLTIDSAIPLGLIFNELFTNSIKHAQTKDLQITITQDINSKQRKFIYSDNGIGMSIQSINLEKSNSIGLSLIDLLAAQLEAIIEFESPNKVDSGFYFSIEGNFE